MTNKKFWEVGEFDEMGGYDCMTSGVYVGNALLDGRMYGETSLQGLSEEARAEMLADAHLISAAPDLLEALVEMINTHPVSTHESQAEAITKATEAIKRATGSKA